MPISVEDVQQAALEIGLPLIPKGVVQDILDRYPAEQEQDPSATWDLVIDNMLGATTMSRCSDVHPRGANVCYGSASYKSACPEFQAEDDAGCRPLCTYCTVRNSRGYCERSGREEP